MFGLLIVSQPAYTRLTHARQLAMSRVNPA